MDDIKVGVSNIIMPIKNYGEVLSRTITVVDENGKYMTGDIVIHDGISTKASCNNIVHKNIDVNISDGTHFSIKQIYRTSCLDDKIHVLENTNVADERIYNGTLDVRGIFAHPNNVDFYIDGWHFYVTGHC